MGRFVPDCKRIASIYPGVLPVIAMNHGPTQRPSDGTTTWYRLDPVPKEKATPKQACVIEIHDSFEHGKDELKSAAQGHYVPSLHPIASEDIVRHLLLQWTGNQVDIPSGAMPGVMEIVNSVPTLADIQQMKEQQMAYMEYWFMEGERITRTTDDIRRIPPPCKLAAEYLGRPRSWSHPSQTTGTVKCKACRMDIPEDASICHICGTAQKALAGEAKQLTETMV